MHWNLQRDIVKIFPGDKPHVYDKAPSGRLCVDGNIPIEEDSNFIKERKNIANNGLIEVTVVIQSNGKILKKPVLSFYGLPVFDKENSVNQARVNEILKLDLRVEARIKKSEMPVV